MRRLVACALLAGCALTQPIPVARPLGPGEIASARQAENALELGKSTKADVKARFGEATALRFATGYEVWVYRERREPKTQTPNLELVLLFEPAGILAKTRVR